MESKGFGEIRNYEQLKENSAAFGKVKKSICNLMASHNIKTKTAYASTSRYLGKREAGSAPLAGKVAKQLFEDNEDKRRDHYTSTNKYRSGSKGSSTNLKTSHIQSFLQCLCRISASKQQNNSVLDSSVFGSILLSVKNLKALDHGSPQYIQLYDDIWRRLKELLRENGLFVSSRAGAASFAVPASDPAAATALSPSSSENAVFAPATAPPRSFEEDSASTSKPAAAATALPRSFAFNSSFQPKKSIQEHCADEETNRVVDGIMGQLIPTLCATFQCLHNVPEHMLQEFKERKTTVGDLMADQMEKAMDALPTGASPEYAADCVRSLVYYGIGKLDAMFAGRNEQYRFLTKDSNPIITKPGGRAMSDEEAVTFGFYSLVVHKDSDRGAVRKVEANFIEKVFDSRSTAQHGRLNKGNMGSRDVGKVEETCAFVTFSLTAPEKIANGELELRPGKMRQGKKSGSKALLPATSTASSARRVSLEDGENVLPTSA